MLLDKVNQAERNYAPVLTNFLDPREQYILEVIVGSYPELNLSFYGGNSDSERKRAMIAPEYFSPKEEDFELVLLELEYPEKFATIDHRNVLGTLMSLSIERDQLGDIVVGDKIQFILTKNIESYIMLELKRIKNVPVKLHEVPMQDMIQSKENWTTHQATVSALRLDVVLKEMIRKSRSIAKQYIEKKRIKVNHTIIERPDFQLEPGDLLSIQGHGRARMTEIGPKTKKDKLRIVYETLFK
ncbi:RNA-binding protein [Staphylococcus condimenti]|uniref:RNA-binding protein n=1 Tax=Staphylococcus condimenti TaxID=70255 RepID=A0A3S4SGZ5_9STAP|nr:MULTISPECIES: RNA-binding protein [Staphylococcus]MDK8645123.1 RNA-binding protein [Staphylococcus condimenti]PNZ61742.1 RNA-binding protein [Staphylococcus condimenti]QQS83184.1 RNA-binding protein [Staphylococcus condimenti]QRP94381.1 RNA-binding protein [Staphylococcus condimenti]RZI01824.1 RNA-binding protein [Staphylococcus condimenti]